MQIRIQDFNLIPITIQKPGLRSGLFVFNSPLDLNAFCNRVWKTGAVKCFISINSVITK
jgi:hypothetical protein